MTTDGYIKATGEKSVYNVAHLYPVVSQPRYVVGGVVYSTIGEKEEEEEEERTGGVKGRGY